MKDFTAILRMTLVGLVIAALCGINSGHGQETCGADKSMHGQPCELSAKAFLNLLMVGKTGYGKSATGNSILGRKVFKTSTSSNSETQKMSYAYGTVEDYQVKVVDLPGLADTKRDKLEGVQLVIEQAESAIVETPDGYDAILIVIRVGRLTEEDKLVFKLLEFIFGEEYTKNYGIIVVTHGDTYDPDENDGQSFEEWIRKETGVIKDIISQCNGRIVLFDNKTKDPSKMREQVRKLIQMVQKMSARKTRYMPEAFKNAKEALKKALIDRKKVILPEKLEKEILNLHEIFSTLFDSPGSKTLKLTSLKLKIDYIISQIQTLDGGTQQLKNTLDHLINFRLKVENNIDKYEKADAEEERRRHSELMHQEHIRRTQATRDSFSLVGVIANLLMTAQAEEAFLNLLLVGKTGYGKSATGNSILGRKVFKTSASANSVTQKMSYAYGTVENYQVKVVDLPGLADTKSNISEGVQLVIEQAESAIAETPEGYDAILIVIPVGRLTAEDKLVFKELEIIFGEEYTKNYGILVVTHEDNYDPDEHDGQSIEEWIRKETGVIKDIISQCNGRIVLFDNKTKDPSKMREQVRKLIQMVQKMSARKTRYMPEAFKNAKEALKKALIDRKKVILPEKLEKEILNLHEIFSTLFDSPGSKTLKLTSLKLKIDYIISQIQTLDGGTQQLKNTLDHLINFRLNVENNIDKYEKADAEEERRRVSQLMHQEHIRRTESTREGFSLGTFIVHKLKSLFCFVFGC